MSMTVTMPQLGESVTEGTIARWLKQPGDAIAKYESIAEVITDKVNAEIPAPADGVMSELIAAEGAVVPVGQPICSIDVASTGADASAADAAPNATAAAGPSAPATPLAMSPTQTAQPPLASAGTPAEASAPARLRQFRPCQNVIRARRRVARRVWLRRVGLVVRPQAPLASQPGSGAGGAAPETAQANRLAMARGIT